MALNFFTRPLFPGRIPDENLVSTLWYPDWEVSDRYNYARDVSDRGCSHDSASKDIIDLLPPDPFEMDVSTTFAPITGCMEDFEVDYYGYGRDDSNKDDGNSLLFSGLNFIWNNTLRFQELSDSTEVVHNFCGYLKEKELFNACHFGDSVLPHYKEDVTMLGTENLGSSWPRTEGIQEIIYDDTYEGAPHEALNYTLSYLGVRDLLAIENVCRSLHATVRGDPLLWRNIVIDQPLNEKITDDILLKLTNMAQGNLQCLSLVECAKITDDGLRRVLEMNRRLTKLSVPGCTRLSAEGIISCLKELKSMGTSTHEEGVKCLRIGGIFGVTQTHFEELKFLLGNDFPIHKNDHKPHFYYRGNFYLSCDDDRSIDIETCPRCQNLRLVYDCPLNDCGGKEHPTRVCRACSLCIARCVECGRCINDGEYEENFCLELLCSDCLKHIMEFEEDYGKIVAPSIP